MAQKLQIDWRIHRR